MSSKRKRYYTTGRRYRDNPSRGGAGVLLTCETGREVKCEREGREILRYYLEQQQSKNQEDTSTVKLSLEQELELLQQQKRTDTQGPFRVFDTGCAGTVFFMYKGDEDDKGDPSADLKSQNDDNQPMDAETAPNKRIRSSNTDDKQSSSSPSSLASPSSTVAWDPVVTVRAVFDDIVKNNTDKRIPGSRFVTRMVPIQKTCFASLEELEKVLPPLLRAHIPGHGQVVNDNQTAIQTFHIHVKKRNCNQISKQEFIHTAAPLAMRSAGWKVQLEDSDFVVWIEVCKTLMGVSVLRREDVTVAKNFNLAELREKHG